MTVKVSYDVFAPFYDHYMQHVDYERWVAQMLRIYGKQTKRELNDVLELACGTGSIALKFVQLGFRVKACDRSVEMLKIAEKKIASDCLYQATLTDKVAEESFDLIVCTFDSVNYLTTAPEILTMLQAVHAGLRKDGLFIFDISSLKNSLDNFDGYMNIEDTKDSFLVHQSDYDGEAHLQKTRLTIFQRFDNHYIRLDETHVQKVWKVAELMDVIHKSGLDCVGLYSMNQERNLISQNFNKLDRLYSRLFFALKK